NIIEFTKNIIINNMLPGAKGTAKASISAFNFWTIFMKIDRNFDFERFLLIPANIWGVVFYGLVNLFAFKYVRREKNKLLGAIVGIFVIGMGSFLFLTNILERYFFAAFAPLIILVFAKPKLSFYLILMNIILFLNLIWAFYRRTSDEIDHVFTDNNFLVIRILSILNIFSFLKVVRKVRTHNDKI